MNGKLNIDVVIPVFNGENYIGSAVQSVLAQTLLPAKLVIVNDGSTDTTLERVKKIKQENITPVAIEIITQVNKGLSAARNTGIRACTASWIAFLDADDRWLPAKLENQGKVFAKSVFANIGLIYCNYKVIDENGFSLERAEVIAPRKEIRGMVFDKLAAGNLVSASGSGVLVKRECFEKENLFDEQLKAFEDWDMWLRISRSYEIDFTDEVLVEIRQHTGSMQKDKAHMQQNAFRFYKKWLPVIYDKETIRQWTFRIAKPVYANGYNKNYRAELMSAFTPAELRKLFAQTFGSTGLYFFLKRLTRKKE